VAVFDHSDIFAMCLQRLDRREVAALESGDVFHENVANLPPPATTATH
jgi:hypothetical protein